MTGEYHYGYDPDRMVFILWRTGRRAPVAEIPFSEALAMASTVCHVAAERAASPFRIGDAP